jgi:hypothetical protein
VLKAFNQKMHVGGIFCDLAKAFDFIFMEFKEQQHNGSDPI